MFQEITEMAKAKGFGEKMIAKIVKNANRSMVIANNRRKIHRYSKNGWTMNKSRNLLSQGIMTTGMYLLLKDRYFPDNADDETKVRLQEEFRRRFPLLSSR